RRAAVASVGSGKGARKRSRRSLPEHARPGGGSAPHGSTEGGGVHGDGGCGAAAGLTKVMGDWRGRGSGCRVGNGSVAASAGIFVFWWRVEESASECEFFAVHQLRGDGDRCGDLAGRQVCRVPCR